MLTIILDDIYKHWVSAMRKLVKETKSVAYLRKLMVEEWRENKERYKDYLTGHGSSYLEELTERFLSCGQYTGELEDLIISGISNAIGLPVAVLSSTPNFPVITVFCVFFFNS